MQLQNKTQLGYCTNIHRGETWGETFAGLQEYTLKVKEYLCAEGRSYGIGLRLSALAARELSDSENLDNFRRWLDKNDCYIFTVNGFPYGKFHGTRVKEQVYLPDWTSPERVEYTDLLFDLLSALLPEGAEGSVSTLPGSFKEFITDDETQGDQIIANLKKTCEHVDRIRQRTGQDLHLGLEPEPLGWFETSGETVDFFRRFRKKTDRQSDGILGVNYDTCHLAVEFEEPEAALGLLKDAGIRISKLHLSSALRLKPTPDALEKLHSFQDDVYLHQVILRDGANLRRYRDLPDVFEAVGSGEPIGDEWRVHFHVPVHAQPELVFGDTRDHILGVLDILEHEPDLCRHLEIETYTWEVLPEGLRSPDVVGQIQKEYAWILGAMKKRGLA